MVLGYCEESSDEPDFRDDDVVPIVRRMFAAQVVQRSVADIPQGTAQGSFYEGRIQRFEWSRASVFAGLG
jgi:hypothetical protein